MVELILVRHGQTDWNVERRYQGQIDTPLNDVGREQMLRVAQVLTSTPLDRVVCSPLLRARSSAEIIALPQSLPIFSDSRLMELDLGAWQGKSYGLKRSVKNWFDKAPHGGECGDQFCQRLTEWLADLQTGTTLVIAHGLVIQVLLMLTCGGTFDEWHSQSIKNGTVTQLRQAESGWQLASFNRLP